MSTFEEQFPELVRWSTDDKLLGPIVRQKPIEDFCLSKQRVREAIDLLETKTKDRVGNNDCIRDQKEGRFQAINILRKELGL